ncbi:MAG: NTP transferase domain-containing protein [archaeon]|nr:NTP transferase domain-containing protein [archaeon]MDA1167343.1 NTP transferase domain-containing protein [archaeon]
MHGIIFAGGKSTRMGRDKSMMFDNITRLKSVFFSCGIHDVIILCGHEDRKSLFEGVVVVDPQENMGLHRVLQWIRNEIQDDLVCVPCDAFTLSIEGLQTMLKHDSMGGVIVQHEEIQPTFCVVPKNWKPTTEVSSLTQFVSSLPPILVEDENIDFYNFNNQEDIKKFQEIIHAIQHEFLHSQSLK